MKKSTFFLTLATVLTLATIALAVGPGGDGRGPGACGNTPGACGGGPGGCGGGGPMMGMGRGFGGDPKFFEETAELRKQLHDKRFEYRELSRTPETSEAALAALEQEMGELRDQIRAKAPEGSWDQGRGPGQCGQGGKMRGGRGGCCNQQ